MGGGRGEKTMSVCDSPPDTILPLPIEVLVGGCSGGWGISPPNTLQAHTAKIRATLIARKKVDVLSDKFFITH